jgi:two-component system, LytTR family, response regulator
MIRGLIVDDEPPARERLQRLLEAHADIECIAQAGDGLQALALIDQLRPDVVFLDIQLPEVDGLTVAAAIPEGGPSVIFVTAFDEHAIRAFELAAVDYLLKPVRKERLDGALDRLRSKPRGGADLARAVLANFHRPSRKMAVRCGAKYVVFEPDRIAAILAKDHYAAILVDGRELLSDDSLDKLMDRLDSARFLRVHRGAIVNLDFVEELQQEGDRKYVAALSSPRGTRVPISREKLDEVKKRLGIV